MSDLAKRLAAHPRFEWRAGMLIPHSFNGMEGGWRLLRDGDRACWEDTPLFDLRGITSHRIKYPPDLTDAATCGVLWAMLVEACAPKGWLPSLGYDGVVQIDCAVVDGEGLASMEFESVGVALLEVWGDGR